MSLIFGILISDLVGLAAIWRGVAGSGLHGW